MQFAYFYFEFSLSTFLNIGYCDYFGFGFSKLNWKLLCTNNKLARIWKPKENKVSNDGED